MTFKIVMNRPWFRGHFRLTAHGRKRSGAKISSATQIVPLALPGLQASEVHRGAELSFSQLFVK